MSMENKILFLFFILSLFVSCDLEHDSQDLMKIEDREKNSELVKTSSMDIVVQMLVRAC